MSLPTQLVWNTTIIVESPCPTIPRGSQREIQSASFGSIIIATTIGMKAPRRIPFTYVLTGRHPFISPGPGFSVATRQPGWMPRYIWNRPAILAAGARWWCRTGANSGAKASCRMGCLWAAPSECHLSDVHDPPQLRDAQGNKAMGHLIDGLKFFRRRRNTGPGPRIT